MKIFRYTVLVATFLLGCQSPVVSSLPVSKTDRTTVSWGDHTNYGPKTHYVHVVRDSRGRPIDIYRYYLDEQGRPILNGTRSMQRSDSDRERLIDYRHGRVVREYEPIIQG